MPKSFSKKSPEISMNDTIKKDPIPSLNWLPPPEKLGIPFYYTYN